MPDHEISAQLSERELEILKMVATGASNQQIAHQLVISVNTVKVHLRNVFEKLEVQSRVEATRYAIQKGWVTVADNDAALPVAPAPPRRTFLMVNTQPPLVRWQQGYLILAAVLALLVVVLPLIPSPNTIETPRLPVIYAQPPTPAPPDSVNPGQNRWTVRASMPTKRAGLALVAFEEHIFAIGGVRDNNQATRAVEIYDPFTNRWNEGATKPTATANVSGAVMNDRIYVPGGCTSEGKAITTLEIYNPQTDSWQKGKSLPQARCSYGLTVLNDRLYVFGGWDGEKFVDTIFVYSAQNNRWETLKKPMPRALGYMGTTTFNEKFFLVGGYDGKKEFNQTYAFDPKTEQWQEKSPLKEKRGGLGLVVANNNLYAVGGGWNQALSTSEKYDPVADSWTTFETPFTTPWRNLGLAAIDTKIYAVGGWNSTEHEFMDSVVSYQFLYQLFLPISSDN